MPADFALAGPARSPRGCRALSANSVVYRHKVRLIVQCRALDFLLHYCPKRSGKPSAIRVAGLSTLLSLALLPSVQGETFTAASDNWPPFFMQADGQLSGIGYEILNEIGRRTGDTINMQRLPNKRALKMFEEGKIDLIVIDSPLWNDPQNIPGMLFSADLMTVSEYIYFTRDAYIEVKTPKDLAGKTVHILHGYSYPAFEAAFASGLVKKHEMYSEQSLIDTLIQKRANAIFMDSIAFHYNISKLKHNLNLFRSGLQLSNAPLGVKVRRARADILPRFNQAIAEMKADGSIDKIVQKYTE
ncbi:MAG: transporter substrate-binding domain-containing protein [Pseudomonadaceae bacterium]|jgi:polar amino acid transport system substrate-binding protein|nr:transporter substrate-binding domain-containing protein [Pseudomonadaceae bacterium]